MSRRRGSLRARRVVLKYVTDHPPWRLRFEGDSGESPMDLDEEDLGDVAAAESTEAESAGGESPVEGSAGGESPVVPKGGGSTAPGDARQHAVVDHIGDGKIRLRLCSHDHNESATPKFVTLTYEEFKADWEILYDAQAVADLGIIRDWPQYRMAANQDFKAHLAKCKVSCALGYLMECTPLPKVRVETKPQKRVVAEKKYAAGDLRLVPNSTSLCVDKPTDKASDKFRVLTETMTEDGRPVWIAPQAVVAPALGSNGKKVGSVELFWCVRRPTEVLAEGADPIGNMQLVPTRVVGSVAMRPYDEAGSALAFKSAEFNATVPLLVNSKDRLIN